MDKNSKTFAPNLQQLVGVSNCLSRKFDTLHCLSGVNKQDGITRKRMQVVLDKWHLKFPRSLRRFWNSTCSALVKILSNPCIPLYYALNFSFSFAFFNCFSFIYFPFSFNNGKFYLDFVGVIIHFKGYHRQAPLAGFAY